MSDGSGSWLKRPRRSVWDVIPNRVVLVVVLFPYFGLGLMAFWLFGGDRPDHLPLVVALAVIAVVETAVAIAWLQRPKLPSGSRGA